MASAMAMNRLAITDSKIGSGLSIASPLLMELPSLGMTIGGFREGWAIGCGAG